MLINLKKRIFFFQRNRRIEIPLIVLIGIFIASLNSSLYAQACSFTLTCPQDVTIQTDLDVCTANYVHDAPVLSDLCAIQGVAALNLVQNGGFESGDFSNWTELGPLGIGGCDSDWSVETGPYSNCLPSTAIAVAPEGTYAAYTVPDGAGPLTREIRQTITLPPTISDAKLNFDLSYYVDLQNFCSGCMARIFSIEVFDESGANVIAMLHEELFMAGYIYSIPWTTFNQDVTSELNAIAGQTVQLSVRVFVPEVFTGPANLGVDAISLDVTSVVVQTDGLASGIDFPLGVTTNSFEATDTAGTSATCSFTVLVEDGQAPDITCPNDTIFDLPPLTCDTIVIYSDPVATDNCDIPVVVQTDATGLTSGDAFPIGTATLIYTASDVAGNTATCSFDVTVNDTDPENVGCININISLDENCLSEITPTMILVGDSLGCLEAYDIVVLDEYDNELSNVVDDSYIGMELRYSIEQTAQNFSCWGDVVVEDKFDPQIICRNDTMSCGEYMMNPDPIVIENCSTFDLTQLNELIQDVQCEDEEISKRIVRTFRAEDGHGNESPSCNDTLYIRKFDLNEIVMPEFDNKLDCHYGFPTDANGNPAPEAFGVPMHDGAPIYPNQFLICNTYADYSDVIIIETECIKKIMRTWTVTTWYCGVDEQRISNQIFTIKDDRVPIISCPPDYTINSDPTLECAGTTELPLPIIFFECSEWTYDVVYKVSNGGPNPVGPIQTEGITYNQNNNRYTISGLPVGQNWVIYTVTDLCGNETECFIEVTVTDEKDPVGVCEQFTVVSVPMDGSAQVYAGSFDDGSFDDCEIDGFSVARLTIGDQNVPNPTYGEYVEFFCDDIGIDQMVALQVWDAAGNTNECMVIVEVQDKIDPVLAQLPDITVSCNFDFDPDNLSVFGVIAQDPAERGEIVLPGNTIFSNGNSLDGLVTDNCEMTIVEMLPDFSDMNNCGLGFVYRSFIISDANGNEIFTDQSIYIDNFDPFDEGDIVKPLNYETQNICNEEQLLPEMLPPGYNFPIINEDECDLVGVTYTDERFEIGLTGACFKIIRHWKVIDWCQLANPEYEFFTFDQVIKVSNTLDPTIDNATGIDSVVCTYDVNCLQGGFIDLVAEGTDDCTIDEDLFWTYMIDPFDNGHDIIEGFGNDASGVYPVGIHRIIWRLEDKCGNVADNPLEYTFEIRNCKAPTAYCINGLSTEIEPMDTDGDFIEDTEMSVVTPDMFDAGSNHVCGYEVTLSFSSNPADQERAFGCTQLGEQPVQLWVTDINGNQSYCQTYLIVENEINEIPCDQQNTTAQVSGRIFTESDVNIDNVEVALLGSEFGNEVTDAQGNYAFLEMETGGNYEVVAERNTDPTEGVSTLDLVLIQKHILNIQAFESPYQIIAADINGNRSISATDLVQLRKMLLGTIEEFPNNTSWRFVDEAFEFENDLEPFESDFPESYEIDALNNDMLIDFIAIKTGDVNGSIDAELLHAVTRSDEKVILSAENINIEDGQYYDLPVSIADEMFMEGIQFTLLYDATKIEVLALNGKNFDLGAQHYNLSTSSEGMISVSYNENGTKKLMSGTELFAISFRALKSGSLEIGNDLSFNSQMLAAEFYRNDGSNINTLGLELLEREVLGEAFTLYQNVPNPWSQKTTIGFELSEKGNAQLSISDITGKVIYKSSGLYEKGYNEVEITNVELPLTGVLFYEISAEGQTQRGKMLRLE